MHTNVSASGIAFNSRGCVCNNKLRSLYTSTPSTSRARRAVQWMRAQPLQLCKAMHSSKAQQCKALSTTRQRSGSSRPARHSRQHMLQSTRCLSLAAAAQPVAQVAEGGVLTDLLTVTLTGGIIAGITLSALPLLSGRAQVGCQPCTM